VAGCPTGTGFFYLSYNEPMRSHRGKLCAASWTLFAALPLLAEHAPRVLAQSQQIPPITTPSGQTGGRVPFGQEEAEQDPAVRRAREEAAKKRNVERQNRIVADTNKLLQLSLELSSEVDTGDAGKLPAAIKKAEEIEKLAKSVKERMRWE
jgi:hypothetical protein